MNFAQTQIQAGIQNLEFVILEKKTIPDSGFGIPSGIAFFSEKSRG
jgi:hypothetical protein